MVYVVRIHLLPLQQYPLLPQKQNLAFLVLLATPEGTDQHQLPQRWWEEGATAARERHETQGSSVVLEKMLGGPNLSQFTYSVMWCTLASGAFCLNMEMGDWESP